MNLQTAKIISTPSKSCWSQVYIDDNRLVVIKIENETDPYLKGKEIISCFAEYQNSLKGGMLRKLKASFEKIQKMFADLQLEIVAGIVFKNALYLGVLNRGKVVLLREGNLVPVLEGKGKLITVSGFLKKEDLFVLGTERFFKLFSPQMLQANLEKKNPEEIVESLAPIIHQKEEDGGVAAVIAKPGIVEIRNGPNQDEEVKNFLGKVSEKLKGWLASLTGKPRPIYIPRKEKGEKRRQEMTLTIAIILAVLLLVSIVFGWQKRRKDEEVKRFNQTWEEIEYKYEQGKELVELNPILARELLSESLALAKERKNRFVPQNWQYKKIEKIEKEIEEELEKVLREYELGEVPIFLDLNLVKKDLKGIDFDFWEKEMVILGEDGTVVTIDLNKKTETKGLVEGGKLVTNWGDRAFILGEKIVEVGKVEEIEKDWSKVVDFKAFAGNLYFLDSGENMIFKIPVVEDGFGTKRNWLGSGVEPDLTEAVDMAIDGDIWVLLKNGEILKFSRGASKAFGISGLPAGEAGLNQGLNHPTAFYTDESSKKIYILDKGSKRIVVLNKSGEYDSQYLWEGIAGANSLIVSEDKKKILLLSGEKIYEIELR